MSAKRPFHLLGRVYPLPTCPPAILTSSDRQHQARNRVRSNQGTVSALGLRHFRWCSSHFVSRQRIPRAGEVQFPLVTNSSVLLRVAGAVEECSPKAQLFLCTVPRLLLHLSGASVLSSSPPADRRPQGAAVRDVKRGKLPGHPALPDERARAVRARH